MVHHSTMLYIIQFMYTEEKAFCTRPY